MCIPYMLSPNRIQYVVVDGSHSTPARVTSGVPQGTVLGPTLFLVYIRDITEGCSPSIRLLADDTIIYREICNQEDHVYLQ